MFSGVMFGRIICKIFLPTFPVDMKLFLSLAVTNPIETHIHGFGSALNDSVGEDTNSAFVVKLERSGTLWVAHFLEGGADGNGVFGVDETGSSFGFLDGGHDGVDDFAVDEDRCVERWRWVIRVDWQFRLLGQIEIAAIAGSRF